MAVWSMVVAFLHPSLFYAFLISRIWLCAQGTSIWQDTTVNLTINSFASLVKWTVREDVRCSTEILLLLVLISLPASPYLIATQCRNFPTLAFCEPRATSSVSAWRRGCSLIGHMTVDKIHRISNALSSQCTTLAPAKSAGGIADVVMTALGLCHCVMAVWAGLRILSQILGPRYA